MPSGLSDSLGASFGPIATYALAAIIVFGLLIVVLAVAKRTLRPGVASSNLRRGPRLAVIDVTAIDQRRKLVLVRRDEVEHLVLIGGQNDLVVEGGILRMPASPSQFPAESAVAPRFDAGNAQAVDRRPSVVAPDLRPQSAEDDASRAPSPLRRPVPPQQISQRRRATTSEVREEPAIDDERPSPPPVRQEPPMAHPGPLLEPAILEEAEPTLRAPAPAPDPAGKTEREAFPADPSPATERPQRVEPVERFVPPQRVPDPAPERTPAVPAFLQRTDVMPEPRAELSPEPAPRPAPVPPVVPQAPASAARPADADRTPPRPEPAPIAAQAPVRSSVEPAVPNFRSSFTPPTVKPEPATAAPIVPLVAQPVRPERVDPVVTVAPPAPEVAPPAVEAGEDADRRPLSVRSFASAIQSRRTLPEPTPRSAPPAAERPAERFRTTATPTYPTREVVPSVPPVAPVAVTATEDGGLEDALSRELDSGFGSLDWGNEGASRAENAQPAKPPVPAASAIVPERSQPAAEERKPAVPERKPTLEEEMERLLNDFDFGPPSR